MTMPWLTKFATMRADYIYVDKTELLYNLVKLKEPCFLARPRYFGKTLTVDTLDMLLRGQRELFKGLWIDDSDYDWKPNPVIRLSFFAMDIKSVGTIRSDLMNRLNTIASNDDLQFKGSTPAESLDFLIGKLSEKYDRKVSILIDEYDSPILLNLHKQHLAADIKEYLSSFFSVLTDNDMRRGFTFITGMTKFSTETLFPSLNNLVDLTFNEQYAGICGFTMEEFDLFFSEHLKPMLKLLKSEKTISPEETESDLRELIKNWYGGYSWDGKTMIFNPSTILSGFNISNFGDYWLQSGIPIFLPDLVRSGGITFKDFLGEKRLKQSLTSLELGKKLDILQLLLQTGFLTVDRVEREGDEEVFILKIPNLDTRAKLFPFFLPLNPLKRPFKAQKLAQKMLNSLTKLDSEGFQKAFSEFLTESPAASYMANVSHYLTLFQLAMFLVEAEIVYDVSEGDGTISLRYRSPDGTMFVFEIKYCPLDKSDERGDPKNALQKMKERAKVAMKQIEETSTAKPYCGTGHDVYKVALVVGGRTKVYSEFKKEEGD